MPMKEVLEKQKDSKRIVLLGLAYSELDFYYKLHAFLSKGPGAPDVMVLGTSRVLPIRSEFFPKGSFYNAGRGIAKIKHLRAFLKHIPRGKEPKVMIVGLDQNFFNSHWDSFAEDPIESRFLKGPDPFATLANSWAIVYKDFLKKKFSLKHFFRPERKVRIGFNALVNDEGYRNDGSYRYGKFLKLPHASTSLDFGYRNTFRVIEKGVDRFEFNNEVSEAAVQELSLFLSECKERNIEVIAFLPPYAHAIYDKLKSTGKHRYIFALPDVLRPVFQKYAFDFHDFSDLLSLGMDDRETVDGFHADEKAYLALLLLMAKSNPNLNQFMDSDRLEQRLAASKNDHVVFPS